MWVLYVSDTSSLLSVDPFEMATATIVRSVHLNVTPIETAIEN